MKINNNESLLNPTSTMTYLLRLSCIYGDLRWDPMTCISGIEGVPLKSP
jgi:hypothetical protein